jgi:hypothetical protein
MAGFYPAPQPHYTGDLGTVFDYFSKDGATERDLQHQLKQQQLNWALEQAGLMQKEPDKYLGAHNPNDFEYTSKAYGAGTDRQNADTRSNELKFREKWMPDESQRAWAQQGVSQQNADSGRIGADASMLTARTNADYAPDRSNLEWMQANTSQQNADTNRKHVDAVAGQLADTSAINWAEINQRGKAAEETALSHMLQFMPPETAQSLAKVMAAKAVPEYGKLMAMEQEQKAARAAALLGTAGHGATSARDHAASAAGGYMDSAPRGHSQLPGGTNNAPTQTGVGANGLPQFVQQVLSKAPPTPRQGPINDKQVYTNIVNQAHPAKVKRPEEMGLPSEQGFADPFNGLIDNPGNEPAPQQYRNNIPGGQPRFVPQFIPGVGVVLTPAQ